VGNCGVEEEAARRLWNARQVMHGARQLDSGVMNDLPELSQFLRAAVNGSLKEALGIPPDGPPLVEARKFSILPHTSLYGSRAILATDLAWP
jgi:hypothetical protein